MREAGLIISSDLCPAAPGSSTRLSTSLQIISCNRLGQSVLSFLELDYPSPALAGWRGLKTLSAGVMAPPLAVDPTTTAGDRRGASVELWTRITLNSPQRRASPGPCPMESTTKINAMLSAETASTNSDQDILLGEAVLCIMGRSTLFTILAIFPITHVRACS